MIPARGNGHSLAGLGETPWVDATFTAIWDELEAEIDNRWLPREIPVSRSHSGRQHSVEEYGCGAYGCVMPTHTQDLVLKITSDASEAWFAVNAMALADRDGWPEGIVRYYAARPTHQKHERRPLYLLWREEVTYQDTVRADAQSAMITYRDIADDVLVSLPAHMVARVNTLAKADTPLAREFAFEYFEQARATGTPIETIAREVGFREDLLKARRLAVQIMCARAAAFAITQTHLRSIGETLLYYLDHSVFITDTHLGNVAKAKTDGRWVIADPGNVLAWKKVALTMRTNLAFDKSTRPDSELPTRQHRRRHAAR